MFFTKVMFGLRGDLDPFSQKYRTQPNTMFAYGVIWTTFKKITIMQVGFKVCRTWNLTPNFCNSSYNNLYSLYPQHNYNVNHIWNSNEIGIQKSKQTINSKGFGQKRFTTSSPPSLSNN